MIAIDIKQSEKVPGIAGPVMEVHLRAFKNTALHTAGKTVTVSFELTADRSFTLTNADEPITKAKAFDLIVKELGYLEN